MGSDQILTHSVPFALQSTSMAADVMIFIAVRLFITEIMGFPCPSKPDDSKSTGIASGKSGGGRGRSATMQVHARVMQADLSEHAVGSCNHVRTRNVAHAAVLVHAADRAMAGLAGDAGAGLHGRG